MKFNKIEFVEYLAKQNVALLLIDNVKHVAKSPDNTKIVVDENNLKIQWLVSNFLKQKMSSRRFDSEFYLHAVLSDNMESPNVIVPKGKLYKSNIFLMDYIYYDKRSHEIELHENYEMVLNALLDMQVALYDKYINIKRKRIIKLNDFVVFYKNGFKIMLRCRDFNSISSMVFLLIHFTKTFFLLPSNKLGLLNHGDLRTNPNTNFHANPEIRNFGFQKDSRKIFIHDFGSSQTKSKLIFKDVVKIFNLYPEINILSDIVESYVIKMNAYLGYKNQDLNQILELSVILVFFAEFSAAIDRKQYKPEEIVQLCHLLKLKKFSLRDTFTR